MKRTYRFDDNGQNIIFLNRISKKANDRKLWNASEELSQPRNDLTIIEMVLGAFSVHFNDGLRHALVNARRKASFPKYVDAVVVSWLVAGSMRNRTNIGGSDADVYCLVNYNEMNPEDSKNHVISYDVPSSICKWGQYEVSEDELNEFVIVFDEFVTTQMKQVINLIPNFLICIRGPSQHLVKTSIEVYHRISGELALSFDLLLSMKATGGDIVNFSRSDESKIVPQLNRTIV